MRGLWQRSALETMANRMNLLGLPGLSAGEAGMDRDGLWNGRHAGPLRFAGRGGHGADFDAAAAAPL